MPMVRMTNTYLVPGVTDPDDIVRDTDHGIYCVQLGGGQVDPATGDVLGQRASGAGWVCAILGGASVLAGFLSALVYGLRPDDKWDAQFNQDGQPTRSGWPVVILTILTLMIGTGLLMAGLAITFQTYFESQVQAAKELSQ